MKFNSSLFVFLFPVIAILYFLIPFRFRWIWLLAASYYFYSASEPVFLMLLVISTVVDFFVAIGLENAATRREKKFLLSLSIITNIGILATFKYLGFFTEIVNFLFRTSAHADMVGFILPVGISFYSFQTLSYTIDVYRGQQKAEHHLGYFSLFVSFFPQLVAGPIERSSNLLPQFFDDKRFSIERAKDGLKFMAWGFFKKVVVADILQPYVDRAYLHPGSSSILLMTYFFAFQIYCDFSGYSDIAVGTAKILGFNLMRNFDKPYLSGSIVEFWRRWHISLMTWFKDYVYIPLGGNRVGLGRRCLNLLAVFLISGLWHGANWTFVIWGAYHGLLVVIYLLIKPLRIRLTQIAERSSWRSLNTFAAWFLTFHLVVFSWIIFRSRSLKLLAGIVRVGSFKIKGPLWGSPGIALGVTGILAVLLFELLQSRSPVRQILGRQPTWMRLSIYTVGLWCIIFSAAFNYAANPSFIYFAF